MEYIVDKPYIEIEAKFVNKWCLMLSVSVFPFFNSQVL